MSSNIFASAVRGALSVRVGDDGLRTIDRNHSSSGRGNNYRGGGNNYRGGGGGGRGGGGADGGRWQRGGGFRGRGQYRGRSRGRGRGRGRGNNYNNDTRSGQGSTLDDEGDAIMGGGDYGSYSGNGGGGSRRDRSPDSGRAFNKCSWKVIIVGGGKHSRDWVMNRIKSTCSLSFKEVNFRYQGNDAVFFVDDDAVASAIEDTSGRITTRDGSKIMIKVTSCDNSQQRGGNNNSQNNASLSEEALKKCLSERFDVNLCKLDLSNLAEHPTMKGSNAKLYQPQYMNRILDLIHGLCPNLKILNLSNNRLVKLDNIANLSTKCPSLDELDLSSNDIRFTGELAKIKDHKSLTKLWFKDNPGQAQFAANNTAYMGDVRKRLPSLVMLDGVELPKEIKFELESTAVESCTPDTQRFYAENEKDFELVSNFLHNFFSVYDSGDRQTLLEAYHNDATFSLVCNSQVQGKCSGNSLSLYLKNSRNLRNIKDAKGKRVALLKNKKLNIVAFLNDLPKTKHHLDSITLDLSFTSDYMLIFSVQGVFVEGNDHIPRGFSRTFIGQREGASFTLMNDHLHVRNATDTQKDAIDSAPTVVVSTPPVSSGDQQPVQLTDAQKQVLIQNFCAESKMNVQYSTMCLSAANWDYQGAANIFMEKQRNGAIPPEAFV